MILVVQELAFTNKNLRAKWAERELRMFELVRDIVASAPGMQVSSSQALLNNATFLHFAFVELGSSMSAPKSACWESALVIIQNLPPTLIDHDSLPKVKISMIR